MADTVSKEQLLTRVKMLESQVREKEQELRRAYSALLHRDLQATLEDGTLVSTLAFVHDPQLQASLRKLKS